MYYDRELSVCIAAVINFTVKLCRLIKLLSFTCLRRKPLFRQCSGTSSLVNK